MKTYVIAIALSIVLAVMFSCRKDHKCHDPSNINCDNYDSCLQYHNLSADFTIQENWGNDFTNSDTLWRYIPTDTIYTQAAVFTAKDTTVDSLKWQIGAGVYTDRSVYIDFTNYQQTSHAPIPITLTVYRHRAKCYPHDDTVKTSTRNIYFADSSIIYGVYRGYYDGTPTDTGTVSIHYDGAPAYTITMRGLPHGCTGNQYNNLWIPLGHLYILYSSFYFQKMTDTMGYTGLCNHVVGAGYYSAGLRSLSVKYRTIDDGAIHSFTGIRQ